jgi:hypothetical protein
MTFARLKSDRDRPTKTVIRTNLRAYAVAAVVASTTAAGAELTPASAVK